MARARASVAPMSATHIQAQMQAQKLFARCFTKQDFDFLQLQPRFIEATLKLETIKDAMAAVELGGQLLKATWRRPSTHAETNCAPLRVPTGVNSPCSQPSSPYSHTWAQNSVTNVWCSSVRPLIRCQ